MAGIGFGPLLSAIGAGLGQGIQDLQRQRAQQQQLQLQQQNAQRQQAMLQAYLQKQQQAGDLAALSAPGELSGLVGQPSQSGGLPGSPYVGSGGGMMAGGATDPASLVKKYESSGNYNVGYGGADLSGAPHDAYGFPQWAGKMGPAGISHAAGGYQFEPATWDPAAQKLGIHDFSPQSQDAVFNEVSKGGTDLSAWAPYNANLRHALSQGMGQGPAAPSRMTVPAQAVPTMPDVPAEPDQESATPQAPAMVDSQTGAPVPAGAIWKTPNLYFYQGKMKRGVPASGGAPQQTAQASPQQTGDPTTDAAPPMAMPSPPNFSQIYREKQALAQSRGINDPAAVAAAATQEFTRQRQAFTENMAIYSSTRTDRRENQSLQQGAVRLDLEKRRLADEEKRAQQMGVSEPFNAQVTTPDGKTEVRMVFTKKGTPGFFDADSGERVKGRITKTTGAMTAPIDDETADMLAEARMKGDQTALQGLGYGNQGAMNREKVYKAMQKMGATGAQLAGARADFSAAIAGAQTAGRRGAQIGMAINELQAFIPEAKRISELVDRTQFPTLNSLLLSAQAGTGDENVRRLALVTNEVINAYAQVATRGGMPTDAARQSGAAILNNAFTKGQYAAALDEMMQLATAAQTAPAATIKETVDRLSGQYAGAAQPGATPPQQGAPQGGGGHQEGDTATNPQTGAKIVYRGGQWVPTQ